MDTDLISKMREKEVKSDTILIISFALSTCLVILLNVNDAWLVPEHTQCNMNFLLSIMPFIQLNIAIKMVSYLTYLVVFIVVLMFLLDKGLYTLNNFSERNGLFISRDVQ